MFYKQVYIAFKGHVQRVRHNEEDEVVPTAKGVQKSKDQYLSSFDNSRGNQDGLGLDINAVSFTDNSNLFIAIEDAKKKIELADSEALTVMESLKQKNIDTKSCKKCAAVKELYVSAFDACRKVLHLDKLAFHADWFKKFYRRNYDALMVKSVHDNVMQNDDDVREWLGRLRKVNTGHDEESKPFFGINVPFNDTNSDAPCENEQVKKGALFFNDPSKLHEQEIVDEIIDIIFFDEQEREKIRADPLVRLLISNAPGSYNFTIVSGECTIHCDVLFFF